MNIKRLFISTFCLFLSLVIINQPLSADAAGAALEAGIWNLRDQGIDPESLIALDKYNGYNYNIRNINYNRIVQFLNDQLRKNQLEPELFQYFVGIDLDWQMIKKGNGYALIIPDFTSSTTSLISSLWNAKTERTASYSLNIQDLNNALATSNDERLQAYKLAIVKAIVAAESKGAFHGLSSAIAQTAFTYLAEGAKTIEPNLQHVFTALASIYPMITGNKQWIAYQKALDEYVLNSLDVQLIKAHIKDLKQQLAEEKSSIKTTLWSYVPYSKKSKSALEERIETIQNFFTDNDLELRLAESIRNKKIKK